MARHFVLAALVAVVLVSVAPQANGAGGTLITSCGQTVTTSAVLSQDLGCTGDGVVVGAPGITIDLNGHRLMGDRGVGDYGVDVGVYASVKVTNGLLRNFDVGIAASDPADHLSVSKVVASGNGIGVLAYGTFTSIASSDFSGNFNFGINVGGENPSIKSVIADANSIGIEVIADNTKVVSTTASGNGDVGMHLIGSSISVTSSTAVGNYNHGITVYGDGAKLNGNRADANGFATPDLAGVGIRVVFITVAPTGKKNTALGNDSPAECDPTYLC